VKRRAHLSAGTALIILVLTCVAPATDKSARAQQAERPPRASEPRITRIEPPNWWVDFTPEVELLATGENLEGANVTSSYPGLSVTKEKTAETGRYLLLWLNIASDARPGNASFEVRTASGETSVILPLAARAQTAARSSGFGTSDVIYLIMPDRFADSDRSNDVPAGTKGTFDRSNPRAYHGGDLRGIREHLDYLRELGVTTIWLTPIVKNDPSSPQDYHGYGAVDEYAVEPHFGTLGDLQELVRNAHAKKLKVILDFVPNHVGPRNPWVNAPPEPDWFHGTKQHHATSNGNFQFLTDPHAPPRYWRDVTDGWFAGILPDLNQDNPDVADYFIDNALWWAEETGIDGYRLDTFPYVSRGFWSRWHEALHRVYPQMTTVGEVFNRDPDITSFFVGGRAQFDGIDTGLTTVFDFPMFFALRDVLSGRAPVERIVDVLSHDRLFPHPELLVPFLGNHDVPRLASEPGMSMAQLKLAYSILLTMRGIPEIYYADEIGMTGGGDPDNRHDFPGGFPGDARNAFLASGRTAEQQELFSCVQHLIALRRGHPALERGEFWHIFWDKTAYAFARVSGDDRLLVVMNTSPSSRSLRLMFSDTPLARTTRLVPILNGNEQDVRGDRVELLVPAEQLEVYAVE
jgi:neopullulanase